MKIEKYGSIMPAYVKNTCGAAGKKTAAGQARNVDKALFSSVLGTSAQAAAKSDITAEVESFASPERIAALKSMIADGSYNIPAEDVAASIFGY